MLDACCPSGLTLLHLAVASRNPQLLEVCALIYSQWRGQLQGLSKASFAIPTCTD